MSTQISNLLGARLMFKMPFRTQRIMLIIKLLIVQKLERVTLLRSGILGSLAGLMHRKPAPDIRGVAAIKRVIRTIEDVKIIMLLRYLSH